MSQVIFTNAIKLVMAAGLVFGVVGTSYADSTKKSPASMEEDDNSAAEMTESSPDDSSSESPDDYYPAPEDTSEE